MNVRSVRLTTNILIGICAVLCLIAVVQYAGVGNGYRWLIESPDSAREPPVGKIDRKVFALPPASSFAAIDARPLFNDDRKPTPLEDGEDVAGDAPPANPLNVTLTGVIVTPNVRIALVRDNARNESIALKVGMPLEGDQASWILTEVKPRSAVFKSAANEDTEIELETAAAPPPGPRGRAAPGQRRPAPRNAAKQASGSSGFLPRSVQDKDAKAKNPDLAKRIEDRRRQMREDAERLRKQRGEKPNPAHKK